MPARPRVIGDRFELRQIVGRGGMATVWEATDRASGQRVAVKIASAEVAADPELRERFEREGKVLRRLRSSRICGAIASGQTSDGVPFLVLELLAGESLDALLEREGYLALDEATGIIEGILEALVVAHGAGVIHRDLSPANVFLDRGHGARGEATVKILDFGIAKAELPTTGKPGKRSGPLTAERSTMGSLPYAAPEQLGESARVTPRADLYAVGAILFRALAGKPPFGGARGMQLIALKREHDPPDLDEATGERWPAALNAFLTRMLAREPPKRPASAEVALAALRRAARGPGPRLAVPDAKSVIDAPPTTTMKQDRRRRQP